MKIDGPPARRPGDRSMGAAANYKEALDVAAAAGYANVRTYLIDHYRRLRSSAAVGREIGVARCTITRWLRNIGEPIRPRGGNNNPKGRYRK
jgi:hypothetical protein